MAKFLIGVLIGVILSVALVVIGAFSLARFGTEKRAVIPDSATLILRLEGEIPERPPIEFPIPFFEQQAASTVKDVWELLRKAAVDTRKDADLQIIARTDARAIEGLDKAIERARAYATAGADLTFVEAPLSLSELDRIASEVGVPQVANIVFGGKTPDPGRTRLAEMGFSIVLYANAILQAALKASNEVLLALKKDGSLEPVRGRLASFEERQQSVAKDYWDDLERRYRVDDAATG